jgi:hypothetical protein
MEMAAWSKMLIATIIFSAREWLLPASLLVLGAIILTTWGIVRGPRTGIIGILSLVLKGLGAIALGLCLLNPLWSGSRARPGANYFAIVADNSKGMNIHDLGDPHSRGENMRERLIDEKSTWTTALTELFQVRRFRFDSQLQSVKDFADLPLDGRSSRIGNALKQVADRFRGQPLAGILLLSDGNATDLKENLSELPAGVPIYPVVVGKDEPVRDVGIRSISVSKTAFEDAPAVTLDI